MIPPLRGCSWLMMPRVWSSHGSYRVGVDARLRVDRAPGEFGMRRARRTASSEHDLVLHSSLLRTANPRPTEETLRRILMIAFGAATLSPVGILSAQRANQVQASDFDRADRRSRALISTVRCAQQVSMARARGRFGPVDSLGRFGQCVAVDHRFIGVFMEVDTQFVSTTRFAAVDLAAQARRTAPMDTAAVVALARAEWAAQSRGAESFASANRQYTPMTFRFDGDSIEAWLIPVTLLMGPPFSLGGERGYVFTPDGRTLVREIDASRDYRTVVVPDTGTVHLVSREQAVPALSEFVLANALNGAGRSVSIDMPGVSSVLVGRGAAAIWMHVLHKP
jgi:hypothetical protein